MKAWMAAALAMLAGCATTTPTGTKAAQNFTGDPYDVVAKNGVIAGEACGVRVDYAVTRQRDNIVLLGPAMRRLTIRDEDGARHVFDLTANSGVSDVPLLDVWIAADRLEGHVGSRSFALQADGDVYRGTYVMVGTSPDQKGEMEVAGRAALLQMPRAEMAALVGPLLSCDRRAWSRVPSSLIEPTIAVRFGGPPHYETSLR